MSWLHAVGDLLAPQDCAGCGEAVEGGLLCAGCASRLPSTVWPMEPPEGCRSAWFFAPYDHPVGAAWRRGKYRPDPFAIDEVVQALVQALPTGRVDAVVPVPQDLRSSWRRGFFPVGRLADGVAAALGVQRRDPLVRRGGPAQASLPRDQRLASARAAFRARGVLEVEDVLLVDDIMTTGATASACASELLCSGVSRVHLLVVCHAFA